jgi:hypothetical protein
MASVSKPLFQKSRPGLKWEGFRSPDKSEDLPVITQLLQPAVNGKLINFHSLVLPHHRPLRLKWLKI